MNYQELDTYGIYKSTPLGDGNGNGNGSDRGPGPQLMGANTLIGNDVYNRADEDLGDIKEIMLDMHTGRVSYAVLSFGGFAGLGDKLFAVPWDALTLDTVNKRFTLDVRKEQLADAPGFDKKQWPDMADLDWQHGVHTFYGTKPHAGILPRD